MNELDVLFESPWSVVHVLTLHDWLPEHLAVEALRRADVRDVAWRIYPTGEENFLKACKAAGWSVRLRTPRPDALYKVPTHWAPIK